MKMKSTYTFTSDAKMGTGVFFTCPHLHLSPARYWANASMMPTPVPPFLPRTIAV